MESIELDAIDLLLLDQLQRDASLSNQALAELVMSLRADARLCRVSKSVESAEPQVICSLGLKEEAEKGNG